MKSFKSMKKQVCIGLAMLFISAASSASAQEARVPERGARPEHAMMMEKMQQKMQEMRTKHLTQMHDKLKITAAQEDAWKTFTEATAMHIKPQGMRAHSEHQAMETLTTPARMEKMLEQAKDRLVRMQKHLDALKTFYATLSPEQQKIFDDSHQRRRHHMHERFKRGMKRMHDMREHKDGMERKDMHGMSREAEKKS